MKTLALFNHFTAFALIKDWWRVLVFHLKDIYIINKKALVNLELVWLDRISTWIDASILH